ncbi:hypothetical protein C8F01DRAFT_1262913 [Mycena amicta]|nr:hypothetical protein C8F01DRAFT_1262913 [Mycena amicta]
MTLDDAAQAPPPESCVEEDLGLIGDIPLTGSRRTEDSPRLARAVDDDTGTSRPSQQPVLISYGICNCTVVVLFKPHVDTKTAPTNPPSTYHTHRGRAELVYDGPRPFSTDSSSSRHHRLPLGARQDLYHLYAQRMILIRGMGDVSKIQTSLRYPPYTSNPKIAPRAPLTASRRPREHAALVSDGRQRCQVDISHPSLHSLILPAVYHSPAPLAHPLLEYPDVVLMHAFAQVKEQRLCRVHWPWDVHYVTGALSRAQTEDVAGDAELSWPEETRRDETRRATSLQMVGLGTKMVCAGTKMLSRALWLPLSRLTVTAEDANP